MDANTQEDKKYGRALTLMASRIEMGRQLDAIFEGTALEKLSPEEKLLIISMAGGVKGLKKRIPNTKKDYRESGNTSNGDGKQKFNKNAIHQLPSDLPKNIADGQQGKHVRGHNNFRTGRSYFNSDIDPNKLLQEIHQGKYPVVGKGQRGYPIVEFGKPIGIDGKTGKPVTRGQIHYGKNGTHIVSDSRR